MMTDVFWLSLAMIQLLTFSVGARSILKRLNLVKIDNDLVVSGAFGLLLISAAANLVGVLGLPTVWYAVLVAAMLQLVGIFSLKEIAKEVRERFFRDRLYWSVAGLVLLILPMALWIKMFADLPGLPSAHDGMSHSAFFMTLVQHGNALLHRNPMEWTEFFGFARPAYYPTGTHLIAATFELPWIWLGVLNQAQALKTWQLLHIVLIYGMVGWISARCFPKANRWLWILNGVMALGYFWYPGFATDSGGFSRSMALFLTLPLVTSLASSERDRHFDRWYAMLIGVGLFASFPYHTAATCFFGFSALIFGSMHIWHLRRDAKRCAIFVLSSSFAFGLSAVALLILLRDSGSVDQIDSANAVLHDAEFSTNLLLERWRIVFVTAYGNYFPVWKSFPLGFAMRPILVGFGIIGIVASLRSSALRAPRVVVVYPILFSLVSLFLAYVYYAPSRLLYRIGLMFLNYPGRLAELNYLAVVIVMMMGLIMAASWMQKLYALRSGRTWRFGVWFFAVCLMGLCIREQRDQVIMTSRHLDHWWTTYKSPRHSTTGELAAFIHTSTEADAKLIYPDDSLGSLIPRTHRRGILVYNECPHNHNENCNRRIEFAAKIGEEFDAVLTRPNPEVECLKTGAMLGKFYVLAPVRARGSVNIPSDRLLCTNLRYLGRMNDVEVAVAAFSE